MQREKRIPTQQDYHNFDGGHCLHIWKSLPETWRCPGCGRSKFELLCWTWRHPNGREPFWGWMAVLHKHEDHSVPIGSNTKPRFPEMVICGDCNGADGATKRKLGIPDDFSFAPWEIREFITVQAHDKHVIDFDKAREVFKRVHG